MSPIAPVDFFVSLGLRVFVFHLLDVMKELGSGFLNLHAEGKGLEFSSCYPNHAIHLIKF